MKKSLIAAATAVALVVPAFSAPHARAASLTYDASTDTCTLELTEKEANSRLTADPESAAFAAIYRFAWEDKEIASAIIAVQNARDDALWGEDFEAALSEVGARTDALDALFQAKGMVPEPAESEIYNQIFPAPSDIILEGIGLEESGPAQWEPFEQWSRTENPGSELEKLNAWYKAFEDGYTISNTQLKNEVTAAIEVVRPSAEEFARKKDALYQACMEKRSASASLANTGSPVEGSSGSIAAISIAVIAAFATTFGILAATLPMIKQYLPPQIQASLL
ncbi:hypothetical protein [Corynebacterium sp. LK2510]|uniref:hypothetical protein n=1 Tax=Corynebacterium sp. LK2510 TaxID=3110472 RepID=UPI0034CFF5D3